MYGQVTCKHQYLQYWGVNNYLSFEKYILASYWVLVETECLVMGHQTAMWPKLSIMSWVFLIHQAMNLGIYSSILLLSASGIGSGSFDKDSYCTVSSLSAHTCDYRELLMTSQLRRGKKGQVSGWLPTIC